MKPVGLFEKIFRKPKTVSGQTAWKSLTAYSPHFTTWAGSIYESELVRAAIHARATQVSKLDIRIDGTAHPKMRTKLKNAPNAYQTWGQFLYRVSSILDVYNNVILVPVLDDYGETEGIYPVLPASCEVIDVAGEPYLKYFFAGGKVAAMELTRCGILTKHQMKDDFFGSSNAPLRPTMELVDLQNQAIKEAIKSSASYRFMAQMTNFALDEDIIASRKEFSRKNFNSDEANGGLLLFPNNYSNIKEITSKPFTIDAEQEKLIQTSVYNYFGVNEKILQSSATEEELDAFFNGVVEPFAIQLSDVMTRMLFTMTEQSTGNRVFVTANRLQYMSVAHKVELAKLLGDRGGITLDEIRELFNYAPLPKNGDFAPIRGEYYNALEGGSSEDGN